MRGEKERARARDLAARSSREWRVWPVGDDTAAAARDALRAGCEFLAFTSAARLELVERLEPLLREARARNVALLSDAGAQLSLAGCWSRRRRDGNSPSLAPRSFPSHEAYVVRADAYASVAGIDPGLGTLREIDLAWRMALTGLSVEVTVSPLREPEPEESSPRVAVEDALAILYKCLSDESLSRAFPWALAITLWLDGATSLDPLVSLGERIHELRVKRRDVQSARVIDDQGLRAFFPEPLRIPSESAEIGGRALELADALGASEVFASERRSSTTVPSPSPSPSPSLRPSSVGRADAPRPIEVSVIVVTATGAPHLEGCLRSLAQLDFPSERIEILAVDNGSAVDPAPAVARSLPAARLVRLDENRGFTGGNNAAAGVASGEWLALVNDDVVVTPDWLTSMLEVGRRREAAAVASPIYNWSGRRLDFATGAASFEGKGFQLAHDRLRWLTRLSEQPVLFACGAAMLVRRDAFVELGGLDDTFFAYYEDVALGWELWLRGYEVWLAPRASARHRQHASASLLTDAERARLYERNALSIVFTHFERNNRARALSASLLSLAKRARLDAAAARLEAVEAWMRDLPAMQARRDAIERSRRRDDADVLSRFPSRFTHPSWRGRAYRRFHDGLVDAFELDAIPRNVDEVESTD